MKTEQKTVKALDPFDRWMVKSNLKTISDGEAVTTELLATLRRNGYPSVAAEVARQRLELLRTELRAERISYGELVELQSLASEIEPGDVELLEAAGVPEFPEAKAKPYQPKTGQKCHCKPGQHRDNCPDCEGTGWRIDFAAIRARR